MLHPMARRIGIYGKNVCIVKNMRMMMECPFHSPKWGGLPWVAQLNINKRIVLNKAYWTEMEAAFAYDTACDEHGVSKYKTICIPVKSQRQRINDRLT